MKFFKSTTLFLFCFIINNYGMQQPYNWSHYYSDATRENRLKYQALSSLDAYDEKFLNKIYESNKYLEFIVQRLKKIYHKNSGTEKSSLALSISGNCNSDISLITKFIAKKMDMRLRYFSPEIISLLTSRDIYSIYTSCFDSPDNKIVVVFDKLDEMIAQSNDPKGILYTLCDMIDMCERKNILTLMSQQTFYYYDNRLISRLKNVNIEQLDYQDRITFIQNWLPLHNLTDEQIKKFAMKSYFFPCEDIRFIIEKVSHNLNSHHANILTMKKLVRALEDIGQRKHIPTHEGYFFLAKFCSYLNKIPLFWMSMGLLGWLSYKYVFKRIK